LVRRPLIGLLYQPRMTDDECGTLGGTRIGRGSGQSSWLQIQRSRVRFSALSAILRSTGSGTGSTQPREVN
jgi:hypothetical protein